MANYSTLIQTHEDDTTRLYEASCLGSLATLETLIQNNPLILDKVSLIPFSTQTPLHISALRGHLDFTKFLLAIKPQFATEFDSLRRLPLHLASAEGHTEIVQALLHTNVNACLVCDQYERIPLHYAAMRGRIEVVQALINAQPNSITREIFDNGETVLHLCVKHNQLEVLKLLVKFVSDDEEFLNLKGGDGEKTIFDLAVMLKQSETAKYLNSVPKVRKGANSMKQILDVEQYYPRELKSLEMEHIPTNMDGTRDQNNLSPTTQTAGNNCDVSSQSAWSLIKKKSQSVWSKWWSKCKGHLNFKGDWVKDTRDTIMIVATVIASMTFSPALNPPGGLWQDNFNSTKEGFICGQKGVTCPAGTAVLAYTQPSNQQVDNFPNEDDFRNFLVYNSTTFLASLSVILLLISGFPLHNKLGMWLLTIVMCITLTFLVLTYLLGMNLVTGYNSGTVKSFLSILRTTSLVWFGLLAIIVVNCTIRLLIWIVWTTLIPLYKWIVKTKKSMFKYMAQRGARVEGEAPVSDV